MIHRSTSSLKLFFFPTYANDNQGSDLGGAWPAFCALEPGSPTPTTSPTLIATSMSYDSSLSISTVATTLTKAGKGKASKVTKTKGAKAA
jgi:hypothetical protein